MTIAADWPHAADILRYYARSLEALDSLKREALANIATAPAAATVSSTVLSFQTEAEIHLAIQQLRSELHQEVVLMLAATFEAELQVDFQARIARKRKDRISKRFRKLWYSQSRRAGPKEWVRIEEILDAWKSVIGKPEVIGAFKQLVMFRHWLAHGRYWVQKSGLQDVDPYEAWERGRALFDVLPGFSPLPPA